MYVREYVYTFIYCLTQTPYLSRLSECSMYCIYVCVYVCVYVCMYVRMYVCAYVLVSMNGNS